MTMSKHNGLFGRDTGRAVKSKGWKGLKGQAALALAVSLWIGGTGIALAEDPATAGGVYLDADRDNILVQEQDIFNTGSGVLDAPSGAAVSHTGKSLTISGGNWGNAALLGGYSKKGGAEGYFLSLTNGTVNGMVIGGMSGDLAITASGYGSGNLTKGKANGNTLIIKNSTVDAAIGGVTLDGEANNNFVYLENTTAKAIYGGMVFGNGNANGNTVSLKNVTTEELFGGNKAGGQGNFCTGNTLNLYGTNKVTDRGIGNFEKINLIADWGSPALIQTESIINDDDSYPIIRAMTETTKGFAQIKAGDTTKLIQNKMSGYPAAYIGSSSLKGGSTLELLGTTAVVGEDLVFTASGEMKAQEQTHNTVMGASASMAALSAGNDFVGAATEGLAMAGNAGADGVASYANMGGGSMDVETGSHVKTHTWNAILALGRKNEKKLSSTEYGAFFEYGKGNYSTFNGAERGDGSTRYIGGGILGKWQKNNGFYVEGSLRAGSINDDAHNVLRDITGTPYSYETDATYWGAHVGAGREIKVNKTDALDLYAKYFYNHRGSVSFDAGGHYDLDAVESSVLRVGTRYTVKRGDNINYYGGLAVEHEFCGRASGFADGVAIRGADISGTSVRGEIGAIFRPGKKSNVTLDLNLSGFAGQKRGFTGGLSAVFHI